MIQIEQYNSLFNIYIYILLVIPVVIISLLGKKSKILNLAISVVMLSLLFRLESIQMREVCVFLICELLLIYIYFLIRKKTDSKWIYYLILLLSILPLAIVKFSAHGKFADVIGFVGISYISFKIWELIIQIYDGRIERLKFLDTLGFLIFAPPFSSGPIMRYDLFIEESSKSIYRKEYFYDYLVPGIKKIILGAFYKFSIAFIINEYILSRYTELSAKGAIAYLYAYTLYLFFDFAGYSLMAVGTSYLMGIKMIDNFNKPFLARNIKEFWERWHISLSTWFNDFLFSRYVLRNMRIGRFKDTKKAARWGYIVTMMTMGIWHGLYLHYILYGLYHGVWLVLTDKWLKTKTFRKVKKMKYYNLISRIITFHIVAFGMLIFSGFLISI